MAKTVKCYFCKKDLKKEDAYTWVYISKTNKEYKRYCCSLEEKERIERDKELYKKCQYETDEILGRAITNNIRNKELKELYESGYSWEQIYRCIKAKSDDIKKLIEYNDIQGDYQQIRYMMQVIKNSIYDFSIEDERVNQWEQYKQTEEEVEVEVEDIEVPTDMKVKKRKTLF